MANKCGTCGREENFPAIPESELRPYGPGGEPICFTCAFKDEESEQSAMANFAAQLDAANAISPVVMLGPNGPEPFVLDE